MAGEGTRTRCFDTLVACVGRAPRDRLLGPLGLKVDEAGEVVSARPGLYLAGDLIRGQQRFVATAFGDGQRAALLAAAYLDAERRRQGAAR